MPALCKGKAQLDNFGVLLIVYLYGKMKTPTLNLNSPAW